MLVPGRATDPGLPADMPKFKSNRYVLYKLLGRSDFSEVWAGWQPNLCRRVVVKFLIAEETKLLERFKREARIQATLRFPRIPSVYEAGYDELNPGKMFLAIEFIEGLPLDQYNAAMRGKLKEPERIRRNLVLGRQVALALDYLHGKELVHRDIKPQNIIATKDQSAFLIDYGITRPLNTTDSLTMEGFILGTVPFMAPEQIAGMVDMIDGRADIWGLGATLYYVMTGRLPFPGAKYEDVTSKIQYEAPASPRDLNPAITKNIEQILLRMLEKSPENRFRTGDELAKALEAEILKA
jgi:eukaryotic-like serine/threonine-protein kinase